MSTQELVKSKKIKVAVAVVGFFLIVFISFAGGMAVGLHKAKFSYQWGQNYERNFMGSEKGNGRGKESVGCAGKMMGGCAGGGMQNFPRNAEGQNFRNAHGLAGTILSISDNNLIIKDRDNKEATITTTEKTLIKRGVDDLKITDLKANDQLVIMGTPNDQGVVTADLIRVFSNQSN
jgi:hypothetical protein